VNIYRLQSDPQYYALVEVNAEQVLDELRRLNGAPVGKSWSPIKVEWNDEDPGGLYDSDFPYFATHIPVFSKRAIDVLATLIEPAGEILPLSCDQGEYCAFNVTTLFDVLDLHESEVVRFSSGKIMRVINYVLRNEGIVDSPIFKILQIPLMSVFVTERFVEIVNENALRGFSFEPVQVSSHS